MIREAWSKLWVDEVAVMLLVGGLNVRGLYLD
jgi:hypothetical protein